MPRESGFCALIFGALIVAAASCRGECCRRFTRRAGDHRPQNRRASGRCAPVHSGHHARRVAARPHRRAAIAGRHVPGLYVEPMWGGTNAAPTLRGQSHPGPGGNTVGVFVDGVLQANVSGDDAAMFDLERIEVVKGPQSALYGDSTFAGAINFVTRRPTAELQSEANLSAGSDAYRAFVASVSGPLGPPGLLGRASFADREFGGTGVNSRIRGESQRLPDMGRFVGLGILLGH